MPLNEKFKLKICLHYFCIYVKGREEREGGEVEEERKRFIGRYRSMHRKDTKSILLRLHLGKTVEV